MSADLKRRRLLLGLTSTALVPVQGLSTLLQATPRQTSGPFYPVEIPLDDDNDLTITGDKKAMGDWTDLSGRILDINGRPLPNLRVEIWQCDINGIYLHPADRFQEKRDQGFQGHGHTVTNKNGDYRFRTIHPVPYTGRTPHIHIAVFADGQPPFTSQIYVAGEPRNQQDFLFNSIPVEIRHRLITEFVASEKSPVRYSCRFELVLSEKFATKKI